jgi:lipopolysaccharide/colanic/teichoic acid biosynthesis glycosyltransferase
MRNQIKRLLDCLLTILVLIIMCIPMLIIAFMVRWKIGGPAFFSQLRSGFGGTPFLIVKFRTMTEQKGCEGNLLSDEHRLTSFGKFLRSTSLDELPELWNVLKGDMSLVGPRPLLIEYIPLYTLRQARRHEVRPGITGWAQVNGRNSISWEEKFHLDVWYVDNQSLWLDIKILLMTIKKVILRDGISSTGEATMSKFTGSKS